MGVSSYPGAAQSAYASVSAAAQAAANHHHGGSVSLGGGNRTAVSGIGGVASQQQHDCLDYEAKFQVL